METESGAKIAIRGKGSVKEGKGRSDAAHTSNQEEDLHCLIMADTEDKVNKAKKLIHNVIETAASIPEGQNELKRNQLRELAALNGTLRDDENQACQNCKCPSHHFTKHRLTISLGGQIGHRKYDCPEQRNFTANIICRVCGNAGHMARDCPDRQRGTDARNNVPGGPPQRRIGGDAVDREYENLMSELTGDPSGNGEAGRIEAGPGMYDQGDQYGGARGSAKQWERQPTGATAPWQRQEGGRDNYGGKDQGGAAAPPWAAAPGGYGGGSGAGAAPWQQAAPPGGPGYGYQGYSAPGYDPNAGSYGVPPAPPGLSNFLQQYGQAPPPPPGDAPPPPPDPYGAPPPPPTRSDGDYPPPPPPV